MTTAVQQETVTALVAHLEERASLYLPPGHDRAAVRLVRADERIQSRLYHFQLRAGSFTRMLLVKLGGAAPGQAPARPEVDRPRIAPLAESGDAADSEYRALALIRRRFSALNDPRFGSVEVFDQLPGRNGFVMESVDWCDLRTLALRHGRPLRAWGARDARPAFRHAGAWLRVYHGLSAPRGEMVDVHTTRDEFLAFTDALTDYLEPRTADTRFLAWLRPAMHEAALAHLPARMPSALAHGDYAMRNILVGPDQQVMVLDTLARFRTSVYRDLGYFLGDLLAGRLSAALAGSIFHGGRVGGYRDAFLDGYFDEDRTAEPQVRLYEAQTMLERWTSIVARTEAKKGAFKAIGTRAAAVFLSRAIRDRLAGIR